MVTKRRYPLRVKIRTTAWIALALASLTEMLGLVGGFGAGIAERVHLFFAIIAVVGALTIFLNVRYAPYVALPVVLAIFFYIVYRTASTAVSSCTVASGIFFLVSALLCFMLIRVHKI
jgi:hypothetical protein